MNVFNPYIDNKNCLGNLNIKSILELRLLTPLIISKMQMPPQYAKENCFDSINFFSLNTMFANIS